MFFMCPILATNLAMDYSNIGMQLRSVPTCLLAHIYVGKLFVIFNTLYCVIFGNNTKWFFKFGLHFATGEDTTVFILIEQYSLTSLVRHSFTRHPRYYDTFLRDRTFEVKTPSFIRLRHLMIQHLELAFCPIKEGINAKIPFIHVMYI